MMEHSVSLRPVIDSDIPIFFEQQNDPIANEMAAFPAREREAFMAHWKKIRTNESNIMMTILYDGQVAGNMLCFEMEGHREVGYWLGRDFWNKGIASEALRQFLEQIKIRPLYGYVAKHNAGSRRVLEKAGFVLTGEEDHDFSFILK